MATMPALATSPSPTDPAEAHRALLHTLEVLERWSVPPLPEEVNATRADTLPDLAGRPDLALPEPPQANLSPLWQQRRATLENGRARRELLRWRIWRRLLHAELDRKTLPGILEPWLALRDLLRDPLLLLGNHGRLVDWSRRHGDHVAAALAEELQQLVTLSQSGEEIRRIAVLLPLSGALEPAGALVGAGIRIAWFQLQRQRLQAPELLFFDSNQPALDLINRILAAEIQLVIGPLGKDRVDEFAATLAEHPRHPPTLLLNQTEAALPSENFWQFGLPVEREIAALALFARANGMKRAGALMMATRTGLRAGDALEAAWIELGGEWVGTEIVSDRGETTDAGRDLLLLDASARRNSMLQRITAHRLEHIPRQRTDVDVLFIVAPGGRGHQITATLAYNYLEGIPVYSLASIYQPQESGHQFDLENVTFMDMPWMIRGPEPLGYSPELSSLDYRKRLIAFGIDALNVALRLKTAPPDERLPHWGTTGVLAEEDRRIAWTPEPAVIRQGAPVPLSQ